MKNDYPEIISVLEKYFDLLYRGDVSLIEEVFFANAHVYSQLNDEVAAVDMDGFRERVLGRPSPESQSEGRLDKISFIDISGNRTALAKIHCIILGRVFTDYLSLLKVNGNWKIISKVFRSEAL